METALSRSLGIGPHQKMGRIPYTITIVRSMLSLELSDTILAPAGATRLGKPSFNELTTEGRNARH